MKAKELVTAYYSALNRRDAEALLSLLSDHVIHDINQGLRETGKNAFRDYLGKIDNHFNDTVTDLVVMVSDDGLRASAEFSREGTYKRTRSGLPPASGQTYRIRVGEFFEIANGKLTRITSYFNVPEWIAQVAE